MPTMIPLNASRNTHFVEATITKKMSPAMNKAYWHAVAVDWRNRMLGANVGVAMSRRTAQALQRRKMLTIVGDFRCVGETGLVEIRLSETYKAVAGPSKETLLAKKEK